MTDDQQAAELLKKIGEDSQQVINDLYGPVLAAVEKTSQSAVATALMRLAAAMFGGDRRPSDEIARHIASGLAEEIDFQRKAHAAMQVAGSLFAEGRPRERAHMPHQRRRRMP